MLTVSNSILAVHTGRGLPPSDAVRLGDDAGPLSPSAKVFVGLLASREPLWQFSSDPRYSRALQLLPGTVGEVAVRDAHLSLPLRRDDHLA